MLFKRLEISCNGQTEYWRTRCNASYQESRVFDLEDPGEKIPVLIQSIICIHAHVPQTGYLQLQAFVYIDQVGHNIEMLCKNRSEKESGKCS